jgi:hypothetical protein
MDLAPEVDVVDPHRQHQAVMVDVVGRRVPAND